MNIAQLKVSRFREVPSRVSSRIHKVGNDISKVLSGGIPLFQLKRIRNESDNENLRNFIDTFLLNYQKDPTKASLRDVIRFVETADFSKIKSSVDETKKSSAFIKHLEGEKKTPSDFLSRKKPYFDRQERT